MAVNVIDAWQGMATHGEGYQGLWPRRGRRCDTGVWRKDRPRRLLRTLSKFTQSPTLDGDALWEF